MKEHLVLKHQFVEFIPEELAAGTICVSIRFATASHKCCCGCGQKVVTPLSPTDWRLIFDGKTISLDPSIGNWSFACKSHYWIKNNRVRWAAQWSDDEVAAGRAHDRHDKAAYFRSAAGKASESEQQPVPEASPTDGLWQRIWKRLS
jgi:hypothetical protein